jgi:L-lactate dehydrogenase
MKNTIAIIGAGNVGSTIAYTLVMKNVSSDVLLVDIDKDKCLGEAMDIENTLPFSRSSSVRMGTPEEAGQADIIVITAGRGGMKEGETRIDFLKTNEKILKSIITGLEPIKKDAILLVVSNPVDILTSLAQKISSLPKNQVIGSGTILDTNRLKGVLGKKFSVHPLSVDVCILGEHGESQVVSWSTANISGTPLNIIGEMSAEEKQKISAAVTQEAREVVARKGATYYGIASCVCEICANILSDQKQVMTVSSYHEEHGVVFSLPTVLGRGGVEKVLPVVLDEDERGKIESSARMLVETCRSIEGV